MLIFNKGQAVYPLWWPSLTTDLQTEQKQCSVLLCRVPGVYEQTKLACMTFCYKGYSVVLGLLATDKYKCDNLTERSFNCHSCKISSKIKKAVCTGIYSKRFTSGIYQNCQRNCKIKFQDFPGLL